MPLHRRKLLKTSAGLAITAFVGGQPAAASTEGFCQSRDPLKNLMEGNHRFCNAWQEAARNPSTNLGSELQNNRCFNAPQTLFNEQHPWATVLTCADSRVSPSWIFDTTPGELFVIRSAGNTAFDAAIAAGQAVAVVDGKIVENLHVATARETLSKMDAITALSAE